MPHIMEMPKFKIKQGVSEEEFLQAHDRFNREFMAKQQGYVSHSLVRQKDTWFDVAVWDSEESKNKAFKEIYDSKVAMDFVQLIDESGSDDEIPLFTVIKDY